MVLSRAMGEFDFDVLEEVERKVSSSPDAPQDAKAASNGPARPASPTKEPKDKDPPSSPKKDAPSPPKSVLNGEVWEVIGGVDRGGIVVRRGAQLVSPEIPPRLSTGALIKKLEVEGDRLKYQRLSGEGPETGWVSIHSKGKEIVVRTNKRPPTDEAAKANGAPTSPAKAPTPAPEPAKPLTQAPQLAKAPEPAKAPAPAKTPEPAKAPAPEPPQPKAPEPAEPKQAPKALKPPEEPAKSTEAPPSAAPRELSPVAEEKGAGSSMNLVLLAGGIAIVAAAVVIGMTKLKKK